MDMAAGSESVFVGDYDDGSEFAVWAHETYPVVKGL